MDESSPKCSCLDCQEQATGVGKDKVADHNPEQPNQQGIPVLTANVNGKLLSPKKLRELHRFMTEPLNSNLMIIEEIEGLMSQVNEKLIKLPDVPKVMRCQLTIKSLALEEIDIFQKTTLFELRKVFE